MHALRLPTVRHRARPVAVITVALTTAQPSAAACVCARSLSSAAATTTTQPQHPILAAPRHALSSSSRAGGTAPPASVVPASEQRIVSGIQPSGAMHLGNYLGAIHSWVQLQNGTFRHANAPASSAPAPPLYIFLADLHALTVRPDPAQLHAHCLSQTAQLLACGIDPARTTLFIQSHVREHLELSWLFSALTPHTWLSRMTQFKDKAKKLADGKAGPGGREAQSASLGLFSYPVLQAADILLYRATAVPVGEDQHQHVELCRSIAHQYNLHYASPAAHAAAASSGSAAPFTFPLPQHLTTPTGRVMSLRNGAVKMSKSDASDASRINLTDSSDLIASKIRAAVTDSLEGPLTFDPEGRPNLANLLSILSALSGRSNEDLLADPQLVTKQKLKAALTEQLVATIEPIRSELARIEKDEAYLRQVLKQGADRARHTAEETMRRVRPAVGLVTAL